VTILVIRNPELKLRRLDVVDDGCKDHGATNRSESCFVVGLIFASGSLFASYPCLGEN
jgi:hypothetical protein